MSKKYVPSGYQIIVLDLSDKTSGTAFTPETEDEKILYEILRASKTSKPILLEINTPNIALSGFCVMEDDVTIYLSTPNFTESITFSDDKLLWTETE